MRGHRGSISNEMKSQRGKRREKEVHARTGGCYQNHPDPRIAQRLKKFTGTGFA